MDHEHVEPRSSGALPSKMEMEAHLQHGSTDSRLGAHISIPVCSWRLFSRFLGRWWIGPLRGLWPSLAALDGPE